MKADIFRQRRRRLAEAVKADLIVIGASMHIQNTMDQSFKFRQDSNFYYLTGVTEAGWVLVMDVSGGSEWLIEPRGSRRQTVFEGAADKSSAAKTSGIEKTLENKAGWQELKILAAKTDRLGLLLPPKRLLERYQMLANPSRRYLLRRIRRFYSGDVVNVAEELAGMRMLKSADEINLIEQAVRLSIDTLNQVEANLDSFNYEYEIEAFISDKFRRHDFEHAYFPIIAAGANATTLHYSKNSAPINEGDLLLIDVGAGRSMYCADITRTYAVGKINSERAAALAAAKDIQTRLISIIKPGLSFKQLESEAMHLIGAALKQLGLAENPDDKKIRQYFPHSVSHFLGIDVHDAGNYSVKLKPGMVITVEPGIYNANAGYGARVEDDVLVTAEGGRVLGYNSFK